MPLFAMTSALLSVALAGGDFKVSSPIEGGGLTVRQEFDGFGCSGENVSPPIRWSGVPEGAKSLALLVHDPDAPTGGAGWWHWSVVDIPVSADGLPEGATADAGLPAGARLGPTDFGRPGWGGPCPPEGHGRHRYVFTLYALGVDHLEFPEGATTSLIGFLVNANAIATARFEVPYQR